jgi:aryl-alcohol dehydrogenase-like predicted oxidoreductase
VYGYQGISSGSQSEQLLSKFIKRDGNPVVDGQQLVVGTKFFTVPWTNVLIGGGFRLGRQSMLAALRASLERMKVDSVDLYQVSKSCASNARCSFFLGHESQDAMRSCSRTQDTIPKT